MAGVHAVDSYFLVVVLRVIQWRLQRSHGLHPLRHLRVTVSYLEGLCRYRLPVWEALDKESRPRSAGGREVEGDADVTHCSPCRAEGWGGLCGSP